MIKLLFFTLIIYAVYSLPLNETDPNEKQPTDKNGQTSNLSLTEPHVQEHSQYPQKRETPSGDEYSIPEDNQHTKHTKREAIDETPKKDEKNERKVRDTTNQKSESKTKQKPSERKARDIEQTDTKPKVPTPNEAKHEVRSVRDISGKDLDTSKTGKEPPKPFTRQRRNSANEQKPNESVKHIDEDKDHPPKTTVKRSAEKSSNIPIPNPTNEKKN